MICFDDEAYQEPPKAKDQPSAARKPDDGFEEGSNNSTHNEIPQDNQTIENPNDNAHQLNAKELTEAFAKKEILCSVINPSNDIEGENKCIERIAQMARMADVVILDWEMPGKDHSIAQNAIIEIIKEDQGEGGCLRLIVIYSAADGITAINNLHNCLEKYKFEKIENGFALQNEHALIVFLNKLGNFQTTDRIGYTDLPDRIITEMLKLTKGLLPSAALRAVSVLRDKSHHLLAKFPARLDGAYIVHRALIPDPNDAETFLLDLLSSELSFILSNPKVRDTLSAESCSEWLDINNIFSVDEKSEIKTVLTEKSGNKIEKLNKLNLFKLNESDSRKKGQDIANKLFNKVYKEIGVDDARADMSVLSTLDRDCRTPQNNIDPPRLKLGSIIRRVVEGNTQYFLCFQPLCDSVRIDKKGKSFPFLSLTCIKTEDTNSGSFDICVRDKNNDIVWLQVDTKPSNIVTLCFKPTCKQHGYIAAKLRDSAYLFQSTEDEFEWCADIKIGKAQRLASNLATRIHTLGIDEFEWMRLHQKG